MCEYDQLRWYYCLRVFGRNNSLTVSVLLLGKNQHEGRLATAMLIISALIINRFIMFAIVIIIIIMTIISYLHWFSVHDYARKRGREGGREGERASKRLTSIFSTILGCDSPGRLQGDGGDEWLAEVCHQDNQR